MRRHRVGRNQTQAALAREAGVSKRTVERVEAGESAQLSSLVRLLRALGLLANLDALVPPPLPSPMEQLRRHGQERQRASKRGASEPAPATWSWGDDE